MAFEAYGMIKGRTQGDFAGESPRKGHEKHFAIHRFEWQVISPRDSATGLPKGQRQHYPFTFIKEVGKCSPQIIQALVTNEHVDAEFFFYHTTPQGKEEQYYSVRLFNATIANYKPSTGEGKVGGASSARSAGTQWDLMEIEEVSLTYSRIELYHIPANTSAIDDWNEPIM